MRRAISQHPTRVNFDRLEITMISCTRLKNYNQRGKIHDPRFSIEQVEVFTLGVDQSDRLLPVATR